MKIVSFSEASNNLEAVLDGVINDANTTLIRRKNAKNAVVMSLDCYNGLMESVHLLRSPANAEHLNRSISQYQAGKLVEQDLLP